MQPRHATRWSVLLSVQVAASIESATSGYVLPLLLLLLLLLLLEVLCCCRRCRGRRSRLQQLRLAACATA
jgi:hypothetical protein